MIRMSETQYAAALAQVARAENEAAYKAGRITVYNGPTNMVDMSQIEARVLAHIKTLTGEFKSAEIADALCVSRPQISYAIKILRMRHGLNLRNVTRCSFALEASPAAQETPISDFSDPPQPKEEDGTHTVIFEHHRTREFGGPANSQTMPKAVKLAGPDWLKQEVK